MQKLEEMPLPSPMLLSDTKELGLLVARKLPWEAVDRMRLIPIAWKATALSLIVIISPFAVTTPQRLVGQTSYPCLLAKELPPMVMSLPVSTNSWIVCSLLQRCMHVYNGFWNLLIGFAIGTNSGAFCKYWNFSSSGTNGHCQRKCSVEQQPSKEIKKDVPSEEMPLPSPMLLSDTKELGLKYFTVKLVQ